MQQKDGKILLHCFAGCAVEDIVGALGLTMQDLFTDSQPQSGKREIVATYDYRDPGGKLLYQVVRFNPKDFRQRRPDGAGGWVWNMKGVEAVPYQLPELLAAISRRDTVFVVEGEKDADRLAALGLTATCNHGGAGKWRDVHSKYFPAGANVVIIPDNDEPGRKHAEQVARSLAGQGHKVTVVKLPGLPEKGDVSNWLNAGGTKDELLQLVNKTRPDGETVKFTPVGTTATELISKYFPEPRWAVPDLLPEGLTILGGKPKIGKSWAALGLAISITLGGKALGRLDVQRGGALYLALEDTERRLKNRLLAMLQDDPAPENLHFYTAWPKLDEGGLILLDEWLAGNPDTRLVIVDTLQKVRAASKFGQSLYAEDYAALEGLKSLADRHGVAILTLHHLKKAMELDPVDMLSGSTGLSGCADAIWILKRDRARADAVLFVTGRDFEDAEHAMKFDSNIMSWQILGNAEEYRRSQERQEIIKYLQEAQGPAGPKEVAEVLGKKENTVKFLLHKMSQGNEIQKIGRGKYTTVTTNLTNLTNLTNFTNLANFEEKKEKVSGTPQKVSGKVSGLTPVKPAPQADSTQKVSKVSDVSSNTQTVTNESAIWDEIIEESKGGVR